MLAAFWATACNGASRPDPPIPRVPCVNASAKWYQWELPEFWQNADADDVRGILACISVGERDTLGRTPLHLVASYGANRSVVGVLLERGADIDARDNYGDTPLHTAIASDRLDVAVVLLENGADVDARDDFGDTPLHTAARVSKASAVEVLLDFGADIEAKDELDNTPLEEAAEHGDAATMSVLLDRGAEVGDLYWSKPSLRLVIDERQTGT
ncbi:MAG: ankyrin repeat domain-containing protein [Chloroflexota bacterium]|nr:ankyrin repeat domain-containing protein [Chloroflexota bacterium]MDE2899295.1 ankyrin repeat domain-containing protein [Chloroflexota bacterium]